MSLYVVKIIYVSISKYSSSNRYLKMVIKDKLKNPLATFIIKKITYSSNFC